MAGSVVRAAQIRLIFQVPTEAFGDLAVSLSRLSPFAGEVAAKDMERSPFRPSMPSFGPGEPDQLPVM